MTIMQEMSRKNAMFTDSVIRRMTRIALDCGAINLAQGFPDFDPPKAILDRLEEVSHLGPPSVSHHHGRAQLPRGPGPEVRPLYGPQTGSQYGDGCDYRLHRGPGGHHFCPDQPGDKIAMFSPYFENYRAQAIMADCRAGLHPLASPYF